MWLNGQTIKEHDWNTANSSKGSQLTIKPMHSIMGKNPNLEIEITLDSQSTITTQSMRWLNFSPINTTSTIHSTDLRKFHLTWEGEQDKNSKQCDHDHINS